jgi:hypothetical protein
MKEYERGRVYECMSVCASVCAVNCYVLICDCVVDVTEWSVYVCVFV